jgi:hypothetical protein
MRACVVVLRRVALAYRSDEEAESGGMVIEGPCVMVAWGVVRPMIRVEELEIWFDDDRLSLVVEGDEKADEAVPITLEFSTALDTAKSVATLEIFVIASG